MRFTYKAQKSSGEFYEGEREAADRFALARELKAMGETLIRASDAGAAKGAAAGLAGLIPFSGRVSIREHIVFTRNLAGMLAAGLTVSRSLSVLERQTRTPALKKVISGLAGRIGAGESLHQAFAASGGAFPPLLVAMVKAGEEGGTLAQSLLAVSEQLDRTYALQRKVRGALVYPAIVVIVMIAVGIVLFVKVVPQLTATFKDFNIALPLSTRAVIALSDFLQTHYLTGLIGILALALGAALVARSPQGKRAIDRMLLHIPFVAQLVRDANAARTGQTLSSLLSSGVEVRQALGITADVVPHALYKDALLRAREAVEKGEPMSGVFRANERIFPPFLSEMVFVGEETGKLSATLRDCAAFFEAAVEQRTKNMSVIIEPALMVIVGVAVGFFAVAMLNPIYSLMNSI